MGRDFQGSTLCRHRESEHEGSRTKAGRQPGRFGDNHGRQWHRLLVQELLLAKQELSLPRLLKLRSKYEALIIDDIGYVEQSRQEMEVLFVLLAQRYERGSVMLTSNLPFSKWERIFKDPMTTAAAIDRLVHHSVILELNLPSYRLEASKRQVSTAQQAEPVD